EFIDTNVTAGNSFYYKIAAYDSHITNGIQFYNRSWYSNSYLVRTDTFQPYVKIIYPHIISHDTLTKLISIQGTTLNTRNGDSVEIFVNNNIQSKYFINSNNSNFSGTVNLTGFGDSVSVKLSTIDGCAWDTITANYFDTINIRINYPCSSELRIDTQTQNILIIGTVHNGIIGDTIFVYYGNLQKKEISVSGNIWNCSFTLPAGRENIKAELHSKFGIFSDTILVATGYYISGSVKCSNSINDSNILISASSCGFVSTTYTNESGGFLIGAFGFDTDVLFVFEKNGYTAVSKSYYINQDTALVEFIILIPGDFYKDGVINIRDAAFLKKYYGKSYNNIDFDGDGIIGNAERNALKQNFFKY
ncbi:MAG TPA: hypothetical protein PKY81_06470, partial [bacterium]|nr:hypothetical protein [bacterium]